MHTRMPRPLAVEDIDENDLINLGPNAKPVTIHREIHASNIKPIIVIQGRKRSHSAGNPPQRQVERKPYTGGIKPPAYNPKAYAPPLGPKYTGEGQLEKPPSARIKPQQFYQAQPANPTLADELVPEEVSGEMDAEMINAGRDPQGAGILSNIENKTMQYSHMNSAAN